MNLSKDIFLGHIPVHQNAETIKDIPEILLCICPKKDMEYVLEKADPTKTFKNASKGEFLSWEYTRDGISRTIVWLKPQ